MGTPLSDSVLQSATNLAPLAPGQNLSTNVADAVGKWIYTETNPISSPVLFYRVETR